MKQHSPNRQKGVSAKPQEKPHPLKSVKEYVDQILDYWFSEMCDPNSEAWFSTFTAYAMLPYAPCLRAGLRQYLFFTINVKEVKTSQEYAPQWENHKDLFMTLCKDYSLRFFRFLDDVLAPITGEQARNIVLSELFIVLQYMPSQFERYTPDTERLSYLCTPRNA